MKIEGDVDLLADRVAHGASPLDRRPDAAIGVDRRQRRTGVHLDRPRAFGHHARGFLRRRLRRVVIAAGPAVDLHAVAHAPDDRAERVPP